MNLSQKFTSTFLLIILSISSFAQIADKYEMRSTWIASVSNIDWPKSKGLSVEQNKSDLIEMLDLYQSLNMNAVFLQVRPECDALYQSNIEPWSRYISGTQGVDPGFDPLQFAIDEGHQRGIEIHAWINPYRINASTSDTYNYYHEDHVYSEHPEWAIVYDTNKKILNPGRPEVVDYLKSVIQDIITNYDVDGIHFDDYFYSYSGTSASLDQTEYEQYGNGLSLGDWRRKNVNTLIAGVHEVINTYAPEVRFGVSPFGIYRSGTPSGISGMDAYSQIYCDPLAWLEEGSVDYLTPQLYWPTGGSQDFETLVAWWAEQCQSHGRHLYAGQGTYRLADYPDYGDPVVASLKAKEIEADLHENKSYFDMYSKTELSLKSTTDPVAEWTLSEIGLQVNIIRDNRHNNALGSVFFSAKDLTRVNGLSDYLASNVFYNKALVPPMDWKTASEPSLPTNLAIAEGTLTWDYTGNNDDYFAIYTTASETDPSDAILNAQALVGVSYINSFDLSDVTYNLGTNLFVCAMSSIGEEGEPSEILVANTDLPTAVLVSPENGAIVSKSQKLEWSSDEENPLFFVQVSSNSAFTNIIYESDWTNSTSLSVEDLELDGEFTYYWRVKTKTTVSGIYSDARTFTTGFPGLPIITAPKNIARNISTVPVVSWEGIQTATEIEIQISTDNDFDNLVFSQTEDAKLGECMLNTKLNTLSWYFIRIIAKNQYGESDPTGRREFQTAGGDVPTTTLLTPLNDDTAASFDEISWETDVDASTYILEVAYDEAFESIAYLNDQLTISKILIQDLDLTGQTTFFWRVQSRNSYGDGYLSEIRRFSTGFPTASSILSPKNISRDIDTRPIIEWSCDEYTDSVIVELSLKSAFDEIVYTETFDASVGQAQLSNHLNENEWYYVRLISSNEFGIGEASKSRTFETGTSTSIDDQFLSENFKIVPTIIESNATIQMKLHANEKGFIQVVSTAGVVVHRFSVDASVESISIQRSDFSSGGVYMVQLVTNYGAYTEQVIVK